MRFSTSPEAKQERLEFLEKLLVTQMSCEQAEKATGFCKSTTRTYMEDLYNAGKIYISGWDERESCTVKLFTAGNKDDAPRPIRGRDAKDDDLHRAPAHVVIRRDDLVAAFFGPHKPAAQPGEQHA